MPLARVATIDTINNLSDGDIWRFMQTRRRVDGLSGDVAWAREHVQMLGRPQAATRTLAVENVESDGISLEGGIRLESEKLPAFFDGAESAILMAITIGPLVEAEVDRLFGENQPVKALVLDAAGSALLHRATSQVHHKLFIEAHQSGYKTGACLGPGGAHWDLSGQRAIFKSLPLDEMGFRLLSSCFMYPRKSSTRVMPIGRNLKVVSTPEESHCKYCTNKYCLARE
jgi:hypothetical protein